jgi:hypothetical protein
VTPLRFTVTSALCFGLNDLDWGPSAGATRYEVYRSPNQAFNPQTLHYSGSGLGTTINVTGTTYLRVRACNAAGCSGYRTGNRAARPTQGCF